MRVGSSNETIGAPTASSPIDGRVWTFPTDLGHATQFASANADLFLQLEDIRDETCLPWTAAAVAGATVNVARLRVPSEARNHLETACSSMRKRKLSEAEQHARTAIEKDPSYVTAWAML